MPDGHAPQTFIKYGGLASKAEWPWPQGLASAVPGADIKFGADWIGLDWLDMDL